MFLLFFVLWGCNKRIEMLAFVVTFIFGVIMNTFKRVKNLIQDFLFASIFVCCFLYIILVVGEYLVALAQMYGLDIGGRVGLFASASEFYDLSFTYMGRGYGFISKFLDSIKNTHYSWALGNAWMGAMHNDIVATYIDIGAWGSFLWFAHYLLIVPAYFRKNFGCHAKYVYCLMMVFAYISYTMDNTMYYFVFRLALYVVIFSACYRSMQISRRGDEILEGQESYSPSSVEGVRAAGL